ncbi:phage BR0599 family protein [Polaromonas sp.]|uniref:baseplate hub domain-containing protein n=1 Tax=Polaromonas sp. TaxID=1869339 RepID=UPI003BB49164
MRQHTLLAAWLPTARQVSLVELLTVTKPSGAVWRYATSVDNVVDGATTWLGSSSAGGLLWRRSRLTFKAGIELSDCTLIFSARAGDTVNALPLAAALRAGVWDDATYLLSRAYFDDASALRGVLPRYQGQLAPMRLRDGDIELTLKPPSQILNRAVPPVYQAACHNTLFDSGCGVSRAAWTFTGVVLAGSTAAVINTGHGMDFTGGVLAFSSGALAGLARTVRTQAAGAMSFFTPFPQLPAVGDAFTVTPGCNRSLGDGGCAKFSNRLRFRGTPFIPQPETAL